MSDAQRRATDLAQFYFRLIAQRAGVKWDGDNDTEVDLMVGYIIDAAAARLHAPLDDAIKRIRQLETEHEADVKREDWQLREAAKHEPVYGPPDEEDR